MRRTASRVRVGFVVGACFLALGCVDAMLWLGGGRCEDLRVSSDRLPKTLDMRARFLMKIAAREIGFDAVAQRRGGALYLVGLAEPGPRLFALRQEEQDIVFVDTPSVASRALATRALDALHRGLWIEAGDPAGDGEERRWTFRTERIAERKTRVGRTRTYLPAEPGRNASPISIQYRETPGSDGPLGYEIDNPGCRYYASVVLIEP